MIGRPPESTRFPYTTLVRSTIETGHEPLHGSRSGRCVVISVDVGRWWCRSCRRSGDAATHLADVLGCSYAEAARSEEHTPELQSRQYLVCRILLEQKILIPP